MMSYENLRNFLASTALIWSFASGTGDAGVMEEPQAAPVAARPDPVFRSATLRVGFAEVWDLYRPIDTIVVGDVTVVDATVLDGNSVVLTALSPGYTNVIILDERGHAIGRLVVRVRAEALNVTSVYNGAERTLVRCDPVCRPFAPKALTTEK